MGHVLKAERIGPPDMLAMGTEARGRTGNESAAETRFTAVAFTEMEKPRVVAWGNRLTRRREKTRV